MSIPTVLASTIIDANFVDYLIIVLYFAVVLGIGLMARRQISDSLDFFLSGRSLPAWVTGLAFISANLGAVEIMGMSANGAQFGLPTVHYFWIGAIPAMLFLGVVMMPFYYGSKVRSVPEFMFRRFGTGAHLVNAISFAVAQLLIAGINLFLLAQHRARAARLAALAGPGRRRGHRALLHHPGRAECRDLQRGAAVLRDRGRAAAADPDRPAPRGRLGRREGRHHQGRRRPPGRDRPRRSAAELLARQRADRFQLRPLVGRRHRLRPRVRAVLRLLDDQLRRGPASDGLQLDLVGAQDADHRCLPEDVRPVHHDPARHDRGGPGDGDRAVSRPARRCRAVHPETG